MRSVLARFRALGAFDKAMVCLFVAGLTLYAGSKHRSVNFPRTEADAQYLVDAGSWVSNDTVHVDFAASAIVPRSAMIYLDYWPDASTNAADMVTWTNATLATFPRPYEFEFGGAVSNRWYCYTDWTPGPTVHTNGVWQTDWQTDASEHSFIIPVRATLTLDGEPLPQYAKPREDD